MSDEQTMELQTRPQTDALVQVEQSRAISETQAAMVIAKRFPRDQKMALDRIMQACTRPGLAEQALYSYSRGGSEITGPSIRLAETIAQQWGNLQFGIRELEQRNGESTVEAFAWDIETNTRQMKVFQVPHIRYRKPEKGGPVALTDPRDIYELVANQGARRLRACVLGIIPGDVIEAAVRQSEVTLKTKIVITPELLKELLEKFAGFGVTKEMLEKYIQRNLDAATPALIVRLNKIGNSLRDGMSTVSEWFGNGEAKPDPTRTESGRKKPREKVTAHPVPEVPEAPPPPSLPPIRMLVDENGILLGEGEVSAVGQSVRVGIVAYRVLEIADKHAVLRLVTASTAPRQPDNDYATPKQIAQISGKATAYEITEKEICKAFKVISLRELPGRFVPAVLRWLESPTDEPEVS